MDRERDVEEWKKKYANVTGELNHYIPNFVRRFEKANEQINEMPLFSLPQGVIEFMESCGSIAQGLKRKKSRLLM